MKQVILAAALVAIALPAYSQTSQNQSTQQFVEKAAISDMFEIQSSKLAMEKSNNNDIKQFARMMVDDHTKVSEEMKSIAQKVQGVQVPTQMDAEHQKKLDQLRSASGAQFDQRYRGDQIQGHEAAVSLFDQYAQSGENAELKSWAQKTLPQLRNHLKQAQALPQSTGAPVTGAAPGQTGQRTAQRDQTQRGDAGQGQRGKTAAIAAPEPNHILGSDLRGTRVRGANDENIGEINDILVDRQGEVVAAIVGVGGFLGIGEKNVAIPFEALEIVESRTNGGTADRTTGTTGTAGRRDTAADRSQSGTQQQAQGTMEPDRIVLRGMTKADLEAAPAFRSDATRTTGQQGRTNGTPTDSRAPR
jgi:putative membrane protein